MPCRVDSIYSCNVGDEGDNDDTANTINSSINLDNIETEVLILLISCIVRTCDTDLSHQNRTDDLHVFSHSS